ncbi:SOSS complex subunit C-like [Styela clava]|uniref:SOSS complex subunit C-like n=1 Tax=Styela clava TaxID=7725 RepID=UPI001939CC9D|nr:SOSS complex subunit C-like [Styela clava]
MKRTVNLRDMSAANNGQMPIGGQDQTRKILSDLQKEKARLRMLQQGGGAVAPGSSRIPINPSLASAENSQHIGANQRNAMQVAQNSSFGYFIPQDSAFGNVILPVVPRIGPN